MEQQRLFDIEPIEPKKGMRNILIGRKRINRNKVDLKQINSLMDQLQPEVKKIPIIVCKQPKTIKMIPCNWTQQQKEAYIKSHYDENGKFKFEPAPDFTILAGQQNRR